MNDKVLMKTMPIAALLALSVLSCSRHADLRLPEQISDHMVLQQLGEVRLRGDARPRTPVKVSASWADDVSSSVRAGADGRWEIVLKTPAASFDPHTITFSTPDTTVIISDVLVGEVWLCSGQSNMEMPLEGFTHSPILHANATIADAANHPAIRMATVERTAAAVPQRFAAGTWKVSSPENAPLFSATAYHFALTLERTLHVPVGIIACAWGGSRVEGWLPEEILRGFPGEDLAAASGDDFPQYLHPVIMYNGLLHPVSFYTVRGFTWYQGCSNVGRDEEYAERLATMVKHWRTLWQHDSLPFYYVQIAPFAYNDGPGGISGALLREAQFRAHALIPHSGLIPTYDLVEPHEVNQIHPANKAAVGERLAWLALRHTYGYTSIAADAPSYRSMEVRDGHIDVFFDNAPGGLSPWEGLEGFEIAGDDRRFHPAVARLDYARHAISVSSPAVPHPVAVRYCFRNFLQGNLTGNRHLPVFPFRTDHWQ
jgi:sialate O-acetylesterase